jgi:hypothetical protein
MITCLIWSLQVFPGNPGRTKPEITASSRGKIPPHYPQGTGWYFNETILMHQGEAGKSVNAINIMADREDAGIIKKAGFFNHLQGQQGVINDGETAGPIA